MKIFFTALLLSITWPVQAMEPKSSTEVEVAKEIAIPSTLTDEWTKFVDKNGAIKKTELAAQRAALAYDEATAKLGDRLLKCWSRSVDLTWLDRAKKTFGEARFKDHKSDFRRAIHFMYADQNRECLKLDLQAALWAEYEYLQILSKYVSSVNDFRKSLPKKRRAELKTILKHYETVQKSRPTPLQVTFDSSANLVAIETWAVDPQVLEFVKTEPAFQGPFSMQELPKIMKQLE